MFGYVFITDVQTCNLTWKNVIVYPNFIMTSPYLFCVHLSFQHAEFSFNWILFSNHFKVRYMYSFTRYETTWKKNISQLPSNTPVLLPPATSLQSKTSMLSKRRTQKAIQSFAFSHLSRGCSQSCKTPCKKDPFSLLRIQ